MLFTAEVMTVRKMFANENIADFGLNYMLSFKFISHFNEIDFYYGQTNRHSI